jgi:small-conductance mechanosensitive channel
MRNLGFKLTLLIFFIALLSGFYLRLPLVDNLVRSFVIYLIFSVLYLIGLLISNQLALEAMKQRFKEENESREKGMDQTSPNMAK